MLRETRNPLGLTWLPRFLHDPDTAIRFAAIQWVGEERLTQFRQQLEDALSAGPATSRLFGGYLAALERLDGVVRVPSDEWALDQYIVRALDDPQTPAEVVRWSLRMLPPDHKALSFERLEKLIAGDNPGLRLEAVRTIRDGQLAERARMLAQIAGGSDYPLLLRAEAIVGLTPADDAQKALLLTLARSDQAVLRDEALRSLRGGAFSDAERQEIEAAGTDDASRELVARVLHPDVPLVRPASDDLAAWLSLLGGPEGTAGDAAAGERVFFHARSAGCARCHQMYGRGRASGRS